MGRAQDIWSRLVTVWESGDVDAVMELYAVDSIYLEPYNPPHNGNLLIQAYLKDYLYGKDELKIAVKRLVEDPEATTLAVEWTFSYTAAGRRWNNLPRASFFEVGPQGNLVYHRDYT